MVDSKLLFKPEFQLSTTSSHYSLYREGSRTYTSIRRDTGVISISEPAGQAPKGTECFGLLGIASLTTAKYLIVIAEATFVGNLKDAKVFRVESCEFFRYAEKTGKADSVDQQYLDMIKEVISQKSFYFSYTYDLTHSLQRISEFSEHKKYSHIVSRADYRFFWNSFLSQELINSNALDVVIPVISGFFKIEETKFGEHEVEFALISRRDHRRAGMRFTTRGLDSDGNAANFAETEQILMLHQRENFIAVSFVQIRGSIPLRWHQKPNLKWAPHGLVHGSEQVNLDGAEKHYTEMIASYGDVYLVNLIDKKGNQGVMGEAFQKSVTKLRNPRVMYTWFDFHQECKKMKWGNISKLVREVDAKLDQYGFFQCTLPADGNWGQGVVNRKQTGIFRTNCMDCLDRTNVVQSVFGRNLLHRQLHSLAVSSKPNGEAFQPLPEPLESAFRTFWADNADVISLLYAGTGALKTDFTRTGKRTKKGAIDDGVNSVSRYIINNFYDGSRKNAVDAFLGKISPEQKQIPNPMRHSALARMTIAMVVCVFLAHIAGKASGEGWFTYLLGVTLGAVMLQKALTVNGRIFVDKPLLDS